MKNINLSKVATMLKAEYSKDEAVELASDKVGYELADAVALEVVLLQALEILKAKEKAGYKPSNVRRLLQRIEDEARTETRGTADVLNDIDLTAKSILNLVKK